MRSPVRLFFHYVLLLSLVGCAQGFDFNSVQSFAVWDENIQTGEIRESINDVVLLVDNSLSMSDEIATLKDSLGGLVTSLDASGLKYRIHLVPFSRAYSNLNTSSLCWNETFGNQLCISGSVVTGEHGNLAPITNTLANLATSAFSNEPGIALTAAALDQIYDRKNGDMVQPAHVVVLSDEDNVLEAEGKEIELIAGRSDYSYKYFKATGATQVLSTREVCLRSPNVNNSRAGAFNEQYFCSDGAGYSGHGSSTSSATHRACDAPETYLCQQTVDGVTTEYSSNTYHVGCQIDPGASYGRRLIALANIHDPGVSNCQQISCSREWYLPQTVSINSGVAAVTRGACEAGFDYAVGAFERTIENIDESVHVLGLPQNVSLSINYTRESGELNETEWISLEAAKAKILAGDLTYADQLNVYSYPEAASDLPPAILPNADGMRSFMSQHYPGYKFTFNAIVSLADGRCEGSSTDNVRGDMYLELAQKTGGVQGDICDPNFDDFMRVLAENVVRESLPSYRLEGYVMPQTYVEVTIVETGQVLTQNQDFEILNGQYIRFFEGVILDSNQTLNVSVKAIQNNDDESESPEL